MIVLVHPHEPRYSVSRLVDGNTCDFLSHPLVTFVLVTRLRAEFVFGCVERVTLDVTVTQGSPGECPLVHCLC